MEENEVRFEKIACDDAEYLFVAYGSSARICQKAIEQAREKGIKVGLLRPITLFPYPTKAIQEMLGNVKGILSVEMCAVYLFDDVLVGVFCYVAVDLFCLFGGIFGSPVVFVFGFDDIFFGI